MAHSSGWARARGGRDRGSMVLRFYWGAIWGWGGHRGYTEQYWHWYWLYLMNVTRSYVWTWTVTQEWDRYTGLDWIGDADIAAQKELVCKCKWWVDWEWKIVNINAFVLVLLFFYFRECCIISENDGVNFLLSRVILRIVSDTSDTDGTSLLLSASQLPACLVGWVQGYWWDLPIESLLGIFWHNLD